MINITSTPDSRQHRRSIVPLDLHGSKSERFPQENPVFSCYRRLQADGLS